MRAAVATGRSRRAGRRPGHGARHLLGGSDQVAAVAREVAGLVDGPCGARRRVRAHDRVDNVVRATRSRRLSADRRRTGRAGGRPRRRPVSAAGPVGHDGTRIPPQDGMNDRARTAPLRLRCGNPSDKGLPGDLYDVTTPLPNRRVRRPAASAEDRPEPRTCLLSWGVGQVIRTCRPYGRSLRCCRPVTVRPGRPGTGTRTATADRGGRCSSSRTSAVG